jgi:putative ABC transport system permease protein
VKPDVSAYHEGEMLLFLLENFRMGFRNLLLHRLRSLLTALGIIFGVTAVITMVAIGQGGKDAARQQMERLGAPISS